MNTRLLVLLLASAGLFAGCTGMRFGVGLPIGPIGNVGVSVGTDGRVGAGATVGSGGVVVGVGGTAQLPPASDAAASAPPKAAPPK